MSIISWKICGSNKHIMYQDVTLQAGCWENLRARSPNYTELHDCCVPIQSPASSDVHAVI